MQHRQPSDYSVIDFDFQSNHDNHYYRLSEEKVNNKIKWTLSFFRLF